MRTMLTVILAASAQLGLLAPLDLKRDTIQASDASHVEPCLVVSVVEQLVRPSGLAVGFENTTDCDPRYARHPVAPMVSYRGWSIREALTEAMRARPQYEWRHVDGVVVVRPTASAKGSAVLERHVAPFSVEAGSVHDVANSLLLAMSPARVPDQHVGRSTASVSVNFGGGSLFSALNAIVKPSGAVWHLGYWRSSGLPVLVFREFAPGDSGEIITLDPAPPAD